MQLNHAYMLQNYIYIYFLFQCKNKEFLDNL